MTEQEKTEAKMKSAYEQQKQALLKDACRFHRDPHSPRHMGLEIEYTLVDNTTPCAETIRNRIIKASPWLSPELGAAQVELHTDPLPVTSTGLRAMGLQLLGRESALKSIAGSFGLDLIRAGTNPWLPIAKVVRTDKEKYKMVPDYYNARRTADHTAIGVKTPVEITDASVVSLFHALQINIEAYSDEDAVDLLNRSFMLSPLMVALSGNARYLSGVDTSLSDLRMMAWSTSVDTRSPIQRSIGMETRVGLPDRYAYSLEDYLSRVNRFPFIMDLPDTALGVGIGMYWKDSRIKVIGDSLVVEFRPLSAQPTPEEDLACTLMYLGRLNWSRLQKENLTPMSLVKKAKHNAMRDGLEAVITHDGKTAKAREILPREIARAKQGLEQLGLAKEEIQLLELLRERLTAGTPSDKLAKAVTLAEHQGASRTQALQIGLKTQ